MAIPDVTPEAIQQALRNFDEHKRSKWTDWETKQQHKYAIAWNGQLYPVKEIIRMATGHEYFYGGNEANRYLRKRNFEIVLLRSEGLAKVTKRIWKISAGSGGNNWPEFRDQHSIGIGYQDRWSAADVSTFESREALQAAIAAEGRAPDPEYVARQLWHIYHDMQDGDLVVAYGSSAVRGVGRIKGAYGLRANANFSFPHQRPVVWDSTEEIHTASLSPALRKTLSAQGNIFELTPAQFAEIKAHLDHATPVTADFDLLDGLFDYFAAKGYEFPHRLLATFVTALQTKGFVILSGLSGTGKTKLAQHLADLLPKPTTARAIADETEQDDGSAKPKPASPRSRTELPNHIFVSVRPDWRDNKNLLGYYNPLTGRYDDTRFLQFLLQAKRHYEEAGSEALPHFVILDEMNLARIEYYFADFLSVLESGRDEGSGHTAEALVLHHHDPNEALDTSGRSTPQSLKLPPNLYIIGTVNMDETTHAFSPKVLDRAFTIEFNEVDFGNYPALAAKTEPAQLDQLRQMLLTGFRRDGSFARIDKEEVEQIVLAYPAFRDQLQTLNQRLAPHDLHFGFRIFDEIMQFLAVADQNEVFADPTQAFDAAVLMKVLPKFNGPRNRLRLPLERVIAWARTPEAVATDDLSADSLNANLRSAEACYQLLAQGLDEFAYPQTARKALRMLVRLHETGFASFA